MKRKNLVTVLAILIGALFIALPLFACGRNDAGYCDKGKHRMGLTGGLYNIPNLTSEQTSKIQKLQLNFQKEMLLSRTNLQTKQLELQTLLNENAEQKKIDAKIDEIAKIRTELTKKGIQYRNEVRKILTDEQKAYFDLRGFGPGYGKSCHGCH